MIQDKLWQALKGFQFDDSTVELGFAQRLARENGWSVAYATRVVEEYKRFIYLAMRAGHRVTPSEAVDQAWHLHLVYTRSYWDKLCGEVLGKPLHHGPTQGGMVEDAKYEDCYRRTLESYARTFGETPPADIWPSVTVRFARSQRWQRINVAEFWILPKRKLARAAVYVAGSVGLTMTVSACSPGDGLFLFFATILLVGVIAFAVRVANRNRGRDKKDRGNHDNWSGGCSSSSSGCSSSGCGGGGCGGGD